MSTVKMATLALGAVLVFGAITEAQANVIQPSGLTSQQDNIILAHWNGHWRGGHWRGGHWRGGWGGALIVAPGFYYGPRLHRTCYWNGFGQYVCYRQYYY